MELDSVPSSEELKNENSSLSLAPRSNSGELFTIPSSFDDFLNSSTNQSTVMPTRSKSVSKNDREDYFKELKK